LIEVLSLRRDARDGGPAKSLRASISEPDDAENGDEPLGMRAPKVGPWILGRRRKERLKQLVTTEC